MVIEHNSRERFYRKPFGAVTCGSYVRLRLFVKGMGIPGAIRLVYTVDGSETQKMNMPYRFELNGGSIYSCKLPIPDTPCLIWYYFELESDQGTVYYGNNSECLGGAGEVSFNSPNTAYQITVYDENYKTPDWFKTAVAYQIFPDRFCNGDKTGELINKRTDIIKRNWGDTPYYKAEQFGGEYLANDFFGGNIPGIIEKLDYIADLGISVIYLNPIFRAASNHKYDTGSYEEVDPMFGTNEDFETLCAEAKKRGIRIILDGVFNHTGSDSQYFNKKGTYDSVGAYQSKESPYYSWFRFKEYPDVYESWWGMQTLPQIEEHNESYRDYIMHGDDAIVKKWIRMGASGWRLDVVDELPDFFVKELRAEIKAEDPDAVIIGEVWEDASNKVAYGERRRYFLGAELDSVMNYPLRNAIVDYALGRTDAAKLDAQIMKLIENYPKPALYSLLNMLSSHDIERILTMMGDVPSRHNVSRDYQAAFKLDGHALQQAKERMMICYGLIMTMPGVPCIYYGDEVPMQGYADPFSRGTFPWDTNYKEDTPYNLMKQLIHLRNDHKALSLGSFESVYKSGSVYAYMRTYKGEKFLIISNSGASEEDVRIDVGRFEMNDMHSVLGEEVRTSEDGIYIVHMPPRWIKVFMGDDPDIDDTEEE